MRPKRQAEIALQQCVVDRAQWIQLVYFLVTHFGENYKLVIHDVKHVQVPLTNNTLEWAYDKEADTLTLEITEDKSNKIITVLDPGVN